MARVDEHRRHRVPGAGAAREALGIRDGLSAQAGVRRVVGDQDDRAVLAVVPPVCLDGCPQSLGVVLVRRHVAGGRAGAHRSRERRQPPHRLLVDALERRRRARQAAGRIRPLKSMMPTAAPSVRSASNSDRPAISSRRLATSPVMLLVVSRAMIRSIGGSICTDDVAASSARANSRSRACAASSSASACAMRVCSAATSAGEIRFAGSRCGRCRRLLPRLVQRLRQLLLATACRREIGLRRVPPGHATPRARRVRCRLGRDGSDGGVSGATGASPVLGK